MKSNSLETVYYDQFEVKNNINIQKYSINEDVIQFNYDDLKNIYAEIYKSHDINETNYLEYKILTCGNKKQIEYYSLDKKTKKTEFYYKEKLLYYHRTEIEYQ